MKRNYSISIAMATYNGEKFIKEQLESILCQLEPQDEIIISDDGSIDDTIKIIKSLKSDNIKIIDGPKEGIKQNFANAIRNCTGKYIFLSDQDDIWKKNKVEKILNTFEKEKCTLIVHNATIVNIEKKQIPPYTTFGWRKSKSGFLKNLIRNSYIGCCMAFSSSITKEILPIPDSVNMHDQWIGLVTEKNEKNIFLKDELILYRRHDNNESPLHHDSFKKMIHNRLILIKELLP